jgi:polyisoprenoid-binding protein YceI
MSTTKWVIDPTHSEIGFKVKHMMFLLFQVNFQNLMQRLKQKKQFRNAKIEFTGAIDCNNRKCR